MTNVEEKPNTRHYFVVKAQCDLDTRHKRESITMYLIRETGRELLDLVPVNAFLRAKAGYSVRTARQYAYALCRFLNFLYLRGKTFRTADEKDITYYLASIQYAAVGDERVVMEQRVSPSTLSGCYIPILGLYRHMQLTHEECCVTMTTVTKHRSAKSYLYGIQSDTIERADLMIDRSFQTAPATREYYKWYTNEQEELLLSHLRTLRDKAMFSVSLDGFRIDEILSGQVDDYNLADGIYRPYRSKGKPDGADIRCAPLSDRSKQLIRDYKRLERDPVVNELIRQKKPVPTDMWLNMRRGDTYGHVVTYHNFLFILKGAASRAGLDPAKIRTHSGRSTYANELSEHMTTHPGTMTVMEFKDALGWKSADSAEPYLNRNSVTKQKYLAGVMEDIHAERRKKAKEEREAKEGDSGGTDR